MSQHQTHTLIRDISPTYEDHDGDHEWDSFNQADLDLLDEIDAQHIQASKNVTKPLSPPSAPVFQFFTTGAFQAIKATNLLSSPHDRSNDQIQSPTPMGRASKVHAPGSTPSSDAPSTVLNYGGHHQPDCAPSQSAPMVGFQTGRGRVVPAPSKQAVQHALEGLSAADFMSSPDRTALAPESPTPLTRAFKKTHSSTTLDAFASHALPDENARCDLHEALNPATKRLCTDQHRNNPRSHVFAARSPVNTRMGGLSTASGDPVEIQPGAIEEAYALLDEDHDTRVSLMRPREPRSSSSMLRDVSNGHPEPKTPSPDLRSNTSPNAKEATRGFSFQSTRPSISNTAKNIFALPNHIQQSRPSTPNRIGFEAPIPSMSRFVNDGQPGPSTHASPVIHNRRNSNRMCIGLTPQSINLSKTVKSTGPRSFVTPFKLNTHPGPTSIHKPGGFTTPIDKESRPEFRAGHTARRSISIRPSVIDLTPFLSSKRTPIRTWLGPPKSYPPRQLLIMGVPESIVYMNLRSAGLWHFDAFSKPFGAIQALGQLYRSGCVPTKATPEWAALQWGLILWKLSGMIRWKPDCRSRLWNSDSAVQQLKYRYEREFVRGQRSAVRLMLDNECPVGAPVCLVVVALHLRPINMRKSSDAQQREKSIGTCTMELSDGWYKIQCTIDAPLLRAVEKGQLKVGQKLAIGGALLAAEGKESDSEEPRLMLEGNSTARARWYHPLGFRLRPWFATLRSLNPDGGRISMMDIIVVRVFPSMYLDEANPRDRWGGDAEVEARVSWDIQRRAEADKIAQERSEEYEKTLRAQHLIQDAISHQSKTSPKKGISNFDVDEFLEHLLEDASMDASGLKKLNDDQLNELIEAVESWRSNFETRGGDEGQKLLDQRVPPRNIRCVQTLRIQDFCSRSSSNSHQDRTAQLMIQNTMTMDDGFLKEGHRYWVQNIQPQRNVHWDATQARVELSLSTRRDTKWRKVGLNE